MAEYHPYVFDLENRRFVGEFEEMYKAEDKVGFDSWHERDLRLLRKQLALAMLSQYVFSSILEVGCGKGTFTHLLKKQNNRVVAIDMSPTAIEKARHSYPDIDFRNMSITQACRLDERFDLVIIMATLAYVEEWRECLAALPRLSERCFVAEFVPPNPIGFVKSIGELTGEFEKHFTLESKVILDDQHCLMMGKAI